MPPTKAMSKAKAAALRALEIDDTLAEAHAAMGRVRLHYDWDWREAEREFKRAIELDPNYAKAHSWYGEFSAAMGRLDEAVAQSRRALDLDPFSLMVKARVGWIYYLARHYEAAIEQERRTLEMDPNWTSAHYFLGLACEQEGRYSEAMEELQILPGECFVIGDEPVDMMGGRKAGAKTIGLPQGFFTGQELEKAGADRIISSIEHLPTMVYG